MVKKIGSLFLWFCAATVFAQVCILGLSAVKGNLNQSTFLQAIALLNGVDIQRDNIKKGLLEARETPVALYEDVVRERAGLSSDLDRRESNLANLETEILADLERLQKREEKFERRRIAFEDQLNELADNALDESLQEVQKILETIQAKQAKVQILTMLEDRQLDDVVAIVKGMTSEKRKKILGEFKSQEEAARLHEILTELRKGEPARSIIEDARNENSESNGLGG